MKNIILSLSLLLLTGVAQAQLDRSIRPKAGPAPEVRIGDAESFVSSNGIKVFVVENHKLPVVSYSLQLDIYQKPEGDKTGASGMVGDLLKAGTVNKTKDEFNETLDAMGATLSVGQESIYMSSLKRHSDKLLALCGEMLTQARFPQAELNKLKKQTISGLATEVDDPQAMSRNITSILNYGKDHPYGEVMSEKTVENITLQDCKDYFNTYFRPNVAYMAVVGDITLAEAKQQIETHLGAWKRADVPVAKYPTPKVGQGAKVAIVNKSAAVQSVVNITYPINIKPSDPDYLKLKVANGILGGGSTGRLFQNLREKHAWTYGSYSSVRADLLENSGRFSATANATTEATDSAVGAILDEMKAMRTELVTVEELQGRKNYMAGTFALGLEDPRTLASYAINIEKNKLPKDYYKNYLKNLEKVTREDVLAVSKKYIDPSIANVTVAGDKKSTYAGLSKFGPVTEYDLYGNEKVEVAATIVPVEITPSEVVNNYINAIGGTDKLLGVKDMHKRMKTEMQGMTIDISEVTKTPNKYLMEVTVMGQPVQKIAFDGQAGYIVMQGNKKEIEADKIAETKETAAMFPQLDYLKDSYKVSVNGGDVINDENCYQLEITPPSGNATTHFYSTETGLLVRAISQEEGQSGKITAITDYSDYKRVDGILIPHTIKQNAGPRKMVMKLDEIEINKGAEDGMFK